MHMPALTGTYRQTVWIDIVRTGGAAQQRNLALRHLCRIAISYSSASTPSARLATHAAAAALLRSPSVYVVPLQGFTQAHFDSDWSYQKLPLHPNMQHQGQMVH